MISTQTIYYFAGGGTALIFFLSVSYWSVNFFIQQFTQQVYQKFKENMAIEAEVAIKLFREGLCEQIVQQENKSESLAKLYATLIDLMRVGKEFTANVGKGEMQQAERRLRTIRETGATFFEIYQKQRLYLADDFCGKLDGFIAEKNGVIGAIEANWFLARKDAAESKAIETEIRQSWIQFEDRITRTMDAMRTEFHNRQHSTGNVMRTWLSDGAASGH